MIKIWILSAVLGGTVQVCEIDGVVTYTDRDDVCIEGEELTLGQGSGTFSTVDAYDIPPRPPRPAPEPEPRTVVVERYFYLPEPEHVHHRVVAQPAFFPVFAHKPFPPHRPTKHQPRMKQAPPPARVFERPTYRPGLVPVPQQTPSPPLQPRPAVAQRTLAIPAVHQFEHPALTPRGRYHRSLGSR